MSGAPNKTVCSHCNAVRPCWVSGPCKWFREQIAAQGPEGAVEVAEWAVGTIHVFTQLLDVLEKSFPGIEKQPLIITARRQLAGGPFVKDDAQEPAA